MHLFHLTIYTFTENDALCDHFGPSDNNKRMITLTEETLRVIDYKTFIEKNDNTLTN